MSPCFWIDRPGLWYYARRRQRRYLDWLPLLRHDLPTIVHLSLPSILISPIPISSYPHGPPHAHTINDPPINPCQTTPYRITPYLTHIFILYHLSQGFRLVVDLSHAHRSHYLSHPTLLDPFYLALAMHVSRPFVDLLFLHLVGRGSHVSSFVTFLCSVLFCYLGRSHYFL